MIINKIISKNYYRHHLYKKKNRRLSNFFIAKITKQLFIQKHIYVKNTIEHIRYYIYLVNSITYLYSEVNFQI